MQSYGIATVRNYTRLHNFSAATAVADRMVMIEWTSVIKLYATMDYTGKMINKAQHPIQTLHSDVLQSFSF